MKNISRIDEGLIDDILSFLIKSLGIQGQPDSLSLDAIKDISIDRGSWLRKGSEGRGVLDLQKALSKMGYPVDKTGTFDDQTDVAVREFQIDSGIGEDGIVGPATSSEILISLGLDDDSTEDTGEDEPEDTGGAGRQEYSYISPVQGGRYNPARHGSDSIQRSMDISGRENHPIVAPIDGYVDKVWWEVSYDDPEPQRRGKRGGRVVRMLGDDGLKHYFLHLSGLGGDLEGVLDRGDYHDDDPKHEIIPWGAPDPDNPRSNALHGGPLLVSDYEGHSRPGMWRGHQRVSQGDILGYMGQSGISSERWGGRHLHYHVKDESGRKVDLNTLGLRGIRIKRQEEMSESTLKYSLSINECDLRKMIDDELKYALSSIVPADEEKRSCGCGKETYDDIEDDSGLWAGGDNLERGVDWEDVMTDDVAETSTIIKKSRGGWQHLVGEEDDVNECLRQIVRKALITEQGIVCEPPRFQSGDVFVPTSKGFSFKMTRGLSSRPPVTAKRSIPASVDQLVYNFGVHSVSGWVVGEYEARQALAARDIQTGRDTRSSSRRAVRQEEEALATSGMCANLYWNKLRDRNDPPDSLDLFTPYTIDQLRDLGWQSTEPDMYDIDGSGDPGRTVAAQDVIPDKTADEE